MPRMSDATKKDLKELPVFGQAQETGFEIPEVPLEAPIETPIETDSPVDESQPESPTESKSPIQAQHVSIPIAKDPLTHQIEKILEDDLGELYFQMAAETQLKFKLEGERVTSTIRQIIKSGIVKIKKILSLILDWLHIIPGVNKFFIEKEAKIKAEKILALHAEI